MEEFEFRSYPRLVVRHSRVNRRKIHALRRNYDRPTSGYAMLARMTRGWRRTALHPHVQRQRQQRRHQHEREYAHPRIHVHALDPAYASAGCIVNIFANPHFTLHQQISLSMNSVLCTPPSFLFSLFFFRFLFSVFCFPISIFQFPRTIPTATVTAPVSVSLGSQVTMPEEQPAT
jgi:hypothetical protein